MREAKVTNDVEREVGRKLANGSRKVTLLELDAQLRAIGYRLDRDGDCSSVNRHCTGQYAGDSYPAVNMRVVQVSDGVGAMNVKARRDANFDTLQAMRLHETLFAVHRGRIYEI